MNIDRFRHLAEARGADIARWPPAERVGAHALLAASPEARHLLDDARTLDAWLDRAMPAVSDAQAERVLAAIERRLAPPARGGWMFGSGAVRRPTWPAAGLLAVMGLCGFVLGDLEIVTLWQNLAPPASGFTTLVASSSPSLAWDQ